MYRVETPLLFFRIPDQSQTDPRGGSSQLRFVLVQTNQNWAALKRPLEGFSPWSVLVCALWRRCKAKQQPSRLAPPPPKKGSSGGYLGLIFAFFAVISIDNDNVELTKGKSAAQKYSNFSLWNTLLLSDLLRLFKLNNRKISLWLSYFATRKYTIIASL